MEALRDDFGLDIRQFNDKEPNPSGVGRRHHVYKVVGWDRPNGRYRSFVTLDTAVRPVNTDND